MNSKKGLIVVILLSVILILVLVAGTIKEKHDNKISEQEYSEYIETTSQQEVEAGDNEDADEVDPSKIVGFVEKVRGKQDIRVLMLGDDMAMSIGRNSEAGIWSEGIKSSLQSNYGSKVDLQLMAEEGATTETGLSVVNQQDITNYDLVVLCYGNNDSKKSLKIDSFKSNYTEIVTKIQQKNPKALMILVLESSLESNNAYRLAINEVATKNSLTVADMRNAFNSSGEKESSIAKNGFPNDHGYQIYTQTIMSKVKEVTK